MSQGIADASIGSFAGGAQKAGAMQPISVYYGTDKIAKSMPLLGWRNV
jgi:hypothetical protein